VHRPMDDGSFNSGGYTVESLLGQSRFLAPWLATGDVGIATVDDQLRYRAINEALATANGFAAEAHIGRTVREILGPVADKVEPSLKRVFGTGESLIFEVAAKLPTRSGMGHWILTCIPVRDGATKVSRVCAIVVEVTEKKALENSLFNLMGKLLYLRTNLEDKTARSTNRERRLLHAMKLVEECTWELVDVLKSVRPSAAPNATKEPRREARPQGVVAGDEDSVTRLSPREQQILQLLASNRNNKEVAAALNLSVRTVEAYRRRIMEKLGAHSIGELVHMAIRHGLVEA
jgi:PAS domain S-box-containing protein